ncbi:hypothetical protein [Ilyobacter polytropus]|uniref:Uncharacterized protein n=1 Tax=Ilyobacter polytropus (strain ATCC 51220 / DSM 2926 / LMG 16218 / CuHBu1) TaxID=572544 RepID=E3HBD8_ILYPC|nr:hypothetical protein [Ilyobacter polytropus]ADO83753.1 hypothetical protein Ilyop_1982 [Ilyobacter polytropus DSM 2926]
MKVLELIKRLEAIKEQDGDIEVKFISKTSRGYSGNVSVTSVRDEEKEGSEKECYIFCRNPRSMEVGEIREFEGKHYKAVRIDKDNQEDFSCKDCDVVEHCGEYSGSLTFYLGECEEFERDQEDCDIIFKKVRKPRAKEPKFDIVDGEKQFKMFD